MADRKVDIDVVKGFGIILMMLGHMHQVDGSFLHKYIYSFHMPLFFLLSGVLYHQRDFSDLVKSKVRSLIRPYYLIGGGTAFYTLSAKREPSGKAL